jgi:5'-nucleotidase
MRLVPVALALALFASPVFAADVSLRIVAINDFHGNLEAVAGEGGAVALVATLARLREGQPNTLFVSSGDLIGASPLPSALAHDEPTLALFKHLGLRANAIGNHELDGGLAELRRQQAVAGFPFLSANLVDVASGQPAFAPYRIIDVDGVRVAFVGATVRNALQPLEPDSVPGLRLDDEAEALNAQARVLRAQGVHALVALLHEGAGAQDAVVPGESCDSLSGPAREITEKLDPDYDLVLSAHTHALYACRVG